MNSPNQCAICASATIPVIDLPAFPLTGIFIHEPEQGRHGFDQALRFCPGCGHAQLQHVIPPNQLYGEQYAHRSSASHLTPSSTAFILGYLDRIFPDRRFRQALEIGCNDLVLLNKLAPRCDRVTGIDPIWIGRTAPVADNMTVIGDYLEHVDLSARAGAPDLVISTHNLEHLVDPAVQLGRLAKCAAEDAVFVIEVPDLNAMVHNLRFDQVFHQHVHYFGLSSFCAMLERLGLHYLDHAMSWRNWGGSLVMAFTRNPAQARPLPEDRKRLDARFIHDQYALFRRRMVDFRLMAEQLPGDKWAFGAAQMLPSLAYHLQSDLSFLKGILDDCPKRTGATYPTIPLRIFRPDTVPDLADATVIITALDAVRPIANRLRDFNPRYILTPAPVY